MRSDCHNFRRSNRRLCCAAFVLSCSIAPHSTDALERPRPTGRKESKQQQESLSISSSKTKAAALAESDLGCWNKSNRMADQGHLAHQVLSSFSEDDFATRLLDELSKQESIAPTTSTATSHDHPLETLILYGILTLAFTSAILTPTVFVDSLVTMLSSVALLLPWLWMTRTSVFSKETVIMCITSFLQLGPSRLWDKESVMLQKIMPVAGDLLKKMLIAEAWSRVWKIAGTNIARFIQRISLERRQEDNKSGQQRQHGKIAHAVHRMHEFFDTSIRKGTNKAVLKTLERNVQAAVGTTLESVLQVLETAVLPLILGVAVNNPKECAL